jgi:hypothetical protein
MVKYLFREKTFNLSVCPKRDNFWIIEMMEMSGIGPIKLFSRIFFTSSI